MISETVVDLCAVVSELAAERDAWRRKVDSLTERLADQELGDGRELSRRREAIEAMDTELVGLRAKLALQTQIATGAATQRDEQTARLAEAQAEIARLKAGKVVDVGEIEKLAVKAYWNHPDDEMDPSVCAAVRAVLAHLGLTPATPQTGEVGT